MSPEELRLFFTFFGTMAGLIAVTKIALAVIRRPRQSGTLPAELRERLERIERAVDTTAIEVERIGEGQRFLTHALGKRSTSQGPPSEPGRVTTPH